MIALAEPKMAVFFNLAVGMASQGSLQLAKTSSNTKQIGLTFKSFPQQTNDTVDA
jgi:hypothetical protein